VRLGDVVLVLEEDLNELNVSVAIDEVEELEIESVELEELEDTPGHVSTFTVFASRVTLPVNPNTPPFDTAPVLSVTEAPARMLPWHTLPVPKVAEVPTCQNTSQACAPSVSTTLEPVAMTKELPI
jgi:hypothetical protein